MSESAHSEPDAAGREGADQPNTKLRLAAMAATVIALLAISVPFVLQGHVDAEPSPDVVAPIASHDAAPATLEEQSGGACMANAKNANLDFTMKDLQDKDVSLSSFKGKVILLNFWATWCGPCKAEIPSLIELQAQYGKRGFVVVGYSVDDEAPKAKAFADEYKMNYPILLGLGREDVQDAFGPLFGVPVSVIIGRDGKIAKKHSGIATKGQIEREIKALL